MSSKQLPQTFTTHPLLRKHPFLRNIPWFWGMNDEFAEELANISDQQGLTIFEDDSTVQIEADLPGMRSEDIELTLDQGVLWIRGERRYEDKGEQGERKFYSKASSSYSYRVTLPGQIDDAQQVQASYEDGILKITLPKTKQSQAKRISIKTASKK